MTRSLKNAIHAGCIHNKQYSQYITQYVNIVIYNRYNINTNTNVLLHGRWTHVTRNELTPFSQFMTLELDYIASSI